jgi:hypothetical protein
MHIAIDIHTRDFRWLWLRYVTGFDDRYHCQACLKGKNSRHLRYNQERMVIPAHFSFALDEFRAPYVYLCGVTNRYEDNLHIAVRPSLGDRAEFADQRIRIIITDAVQMPILPVDADKPVEFLRCRNFQFGFRYLRPQADTQKTLF